MSGERFLADMPGTILLTGASGFTGQHLTRLAWERGYEVLELRSDLSDTNGIAGELSAVGFDYVVHLAAISAVTHTDLQAFYTVNLFGTLNLLEGIANSSSNQARVLIASSANVYGNCTRSPIDESVCPQPLNHYAASKLAMEHLSAAHYGHLSLMMVRPFNYTGVGHDSRFVIPKLVDHFVRRESSIDLGNMAVEREFNDVRTVCRVYLDLLEQGAVGENYNFCSGRTQSLGSVLEVLTRITGHRINARTNPEFVRENELNRLCGNPAKLEACVGPLQHPPLEETLEWMLRAGN